VASTSRAYLRAREGTDILGRAIQLAVVAAIIVSGGRLAWLVFPLLFFMLRPFVWRSRRRGYGFVPWIFSFWLEHPYRHPHLNADAHARRMPPLEA
jgi:hypothetical protein